MKTSILEVFRHTRLRSADLSSGMPQGAQTTVFVLPEHAAALKLVFSSSVKIVTQNIVFVVFGGLRALKRLRV